MLWVRAIWKEEHREEEGVVPSTWVKEAMVLWPNVSNAQRAMKSGILPTDSCKRFPLVKEKVRSGMAINNISYTMYYFNTIIKLSLSNFVKW